MWYIFNQNNIAVATIDIKPNLEDLAKRGEFAIESLLTLPIDKVQLINGKIIEKEQSN